MLLFRWTWGSGSHIPPSAHRSENQSWQRLVHLRDRRILAPKVLRVLIILHWSQTSVIASRITSILIVSSTACSHWFQTRPHRSSFTEYVSMSWIYGNYNKSANEYISVSRGEHVLNENALRLNRLTTSTTLATLNKLVRRVQNGQVQLMMISII